MKETKAGQMEVVGLKGRASFLSAPLRWEDLLSFVIFQFWLCYTSGPTGCKQKCLSDTEDKALAWTFQDLNFAAQCEVIRNARLKKRS